MNLIIIRNNEAPVEMFQWQSEIRNNPAPVIMTVKGRQKVLILNFDTDSDQCGEVSIKT